MRVLGPVLIAMAWALFAIFFYVYFVNLLPYVQLSPWAWPGNAITALGLWLIFNIVYNHMMAVFTPPGSVPPNMFVPPNLELIIAQEQQLKARGQLPGGWTKYCKTCRYPKPERAHHDHVTNQCVLRMDHYCPWIGNTVGLRNYHFFVSFLIYLFIGCVYILVGRWLRVCKWLYLSSLVSFLRSRSLRPVSA